MKGDRPPVATLPPFDQAICDETVDKPHGAGMRQAKDLPQPIVRRAEAVADHHERGWRLAGMLQDCSSRVLDTIGDRQRDRPQ